MSCVKFADLVGLLIANFFGFLNKITSNINNLIDLGHYFDTAYDIIASIFL